MVESAAAAADSAGEDKPEVIFTAADGRGRPNGLVEAPVPVNYFGNCLGGGMAELDHKKAAAEAIANEIKNKINDIENFLKNTEKWLFEAPKFAEYNTFGVSGSPKFDLSGADFGWGKGRRLEVLSMDGEKYSMSLSNSPESGGGLVVGVSLPRDRMEAFAAIFEDGLNVV